MFEIIPGYVSTLAGLFNTNIRAITTKTNGYGENNQISSFVYISDGYYHVYYSNCFKAITLMKQRKPRKLTAEEANRLAIQLQVLRIRITEFALNYKTAGKSYLWGSEIDGISLTREKLKLVELDRLKLIYENSKKHLPYFNSPGSRVDKIKEHYLSEDGVIGAIEVKQSTSGKAVVNFLNSKATTRRRIRQKIKASKRKSKNKNNGKKKTNKTSR